MPFPEKEPSPLVRAVEIAALGGILYVIAGDFNPGVKVLAGMAGLVLFVDTVIVPWQRAFEKLDKLDK